ncbi:hypothetical protein Taro_012351 [Colocasia esculenta]|uniref:Transposase n=1 Tax=Colocasia esculenta TaxID=4460 RepID=A0A843U8I7_COLES|nr:hypothetical protein [Colocasia esculenta]
MVTTPISRAEEVLESTQADPTREEHRQVHLTREVLEAHYTEINDANVPSGSTSRKTRGPTQQPVVMPPSGEKWRCLFIDGQAVGKAGSKLAIVLGLYARMEGYFPPHKQWREQSPQSFEDVMNDIQKDYDFVDPEGMPANLMVVTHFCKESLQKKLRDWRCWLKNHYYIEAVPNDVLMKAPDKRITQGGWELLLKFWESEKKVSEAERNKKNRGEDRPTHTLGAKSIARHNQDECLKLGDSYTTLGAYLKAHQMKNGDYPDEYTRLLCALVAHFEVSEGIICLLWIHLVYLDSGMYG